MERLAASGSWAGLGLTMSEEGGLDEVEESLRAAASSSRSAATSACKASTWACNASTCACSRWQLAQGVLASVFIPAMLRPRRSPGSHAVNGYTKAKADLRLGQVE